jgi:hypothetical protein
LRKRWPAAAFRRSASGGSASFSRVTFSAADARHARLSDHCPVSVRLKIGLP